MIIEEEKKSRTDEEENMKKCYNIRQSWQRFNDCFRRTKQRNNNGKNKKKMELSQLIELNKHKNESQINDYDTYRKKFQRQASTIEEVEYISKTSDWNLYHLTNEYVYDTNNFTRTKRFHLHGSEQVIELHKMFSVNERRLWIRTRFNRRNAIHMNGNTNLKKQLAEYVVLKTLSTYHK